MPTNTFYLSAAALEKYLEIYDRGLNTKDYEYHVALHAHAYYEEHLKQKFSIAFEVNDNPHNYPKRMEEISTEVLRDIILNHFKENTDVDFVLAPQNNTEKKIGYPFQLKKFVFGAEAVTSSIVADYINKKANSYSNSDLSMIVIPVNKVDSQEKISFDTKQLKSQLKINNNALYAVFIFQHIDGKISLKPVWLSSRVVGK